MVVTDPSASSGPGTAARLVAAAAVLVSGLVHLQLYFGAGYRDIDEGNIGRSFLLNAIAAVVLAVALLFRREVLVRLAAAGLLAGTLVAFAVSRTDAGFFGFTESGLNPSPQAAIALVAEIVGLLALAATFVPRIGAGRELRPSAAIPVGAAVVVLAVAGAALWARSDEAEPVAASESGAVTVTIADFEFGDGPLEVPAGTTVEWINNDAVGHSLVADDGSFQSPDISSGERFSFTFTEPGTYDYRCGIHPTMRGTIIIT